MRKKGCLSCSFSSLAYSLTLLNLNSPFLVGCGGQWEDSCFVSLHWLIYISTASLSKWPLSVLTYENYRGHWGPFSFDRLASTQTSIHTPPHPPTHTQTHEHTLKKYTNSINTHPQATPTDVFFVCSNFTLMINQQPSSHLCSFSTHAETPERRDGGRRRIIQE